MSSIEIKVEGLIGSSIEHVARDMFDLSRKLNICVSSEFNGVYLYCGKHTRDSKQIVDSFYKDLKREKEMR